jgi:outer membrane murein-binding lipoprotein Lpp
VKKPFIFLGVLLFLVAVGCPLTVSAATIEDQISTLKKQMEELQTKIQEMESQLNKAKTDAATAQQQTETVQKQMETKIAEVSSRNKVIDELAKKFSHLKFYGYVRSRYWFGNHQQSSFDVTEVAFNTRYEVSDNISGEFHLWFHPSGNAPSSEGYTNYNNWTGPTIFIEGAYAEFRKLNIGPIDGTLQVGKFRNFSLGIDCAWPDRVYSDYGLFHESMTQSRITGLQYFTKYGKFKANAAVFNGWGLSSGARFGARPAGIRYLKTNQENLDDNYDKAVSMRVAYLPINGLEVGFSGYRQELSDNDMTAFNQIMGRDPTTFGASAAGKPSKDRQSWRAGWDMEYKRDPFHFQSQYFFGEVSDVRATWWYVMGGIKFPRFKTDLYLKYSQALYDQSSIPDIRASGAWDKGELAPLIIYSIHPKAKLYFEYYILHINDPDGYKGHMQNNFGFIELVLHY